MKVVSIVKICVLIIIIIFLSECTKDYNYIEKYLGNWNFKVIHHSHSTPPGIESSDTVYYVGTIKHSSAKDEVLIQYSDDKNISLQIDENGTMLTYCQQPSYCKGGFTNDSVFHYSYGSRVNNSLYVLNSLLIIDGKKSRE